MSKPAIFLDRDGTLNEAVGFVNDASRFRLYPWAVDAIRLIHDESHLAIVVTNQSGVGRGLYREELVKQVHGRFEHLLDDGGTSVDAIYYCPHAPTDGCECRKPKAGMLLRAEQELGVDLSKSWVVGDSYTDLQAAWNAGARGALVRTGFGAGSWTHQREGWPRAPDAVGDDLHHALCNIFWGDRD